MNDASRSRLWPYVAAVATVAAIPVGTAFRGWQIDRRAATATADRTLQRQYALATSLTAEADRTDSFKPAYRGLMVLVVMAESVRGWHGLGYQIDSPNDLDAQLQNAYLVASSRVRTRDDQRRLRELESRYQDLMLSGSQGEAGRRMTTRTNRAPAG
jgi:hypothetical protein